MKNASVVIIFNCITIFKCPDFVHYLTIDDSSPANAPLALQMGTQTPSRNNPVVGPQTILMIVMLAWIKPPNCDARKAIPIITAPKVKADTENYLSEI